MGGHPRKATHPISIDYVVNAARQRTGSPCWRSPEVCSRYSFALTCATSGISRSVSLSSPFSLCCSSMAVTTSVEAPAVDHRKRFATQPGRVLRASYLIKIAWC